MATIAQTFREEGHTAEEGRQEGHEEGLYALHGSVINILMLRFGQLSYGLESNIRQKIADTAVLQELTTSAAVSPTQEAFIATYNRLTE